MSKKIAPVNKRRLAGAWIGVALLSIFCIAFALFLEHSTVFGEANRGSSGYTAKIYVHTMESSSNECQNVIETAKKNTKDYDSATNDALQNYGDNPSQLESQLKIIEKSKQNRNVLQTQRLGSLISDLQTKCGKKTPSAKN